LTTELNVEKNKEKNKYENLVAKQEEAVRKHYELVAEAQKERVDMDELKKRTEEDIKKREAALEVWEAKLQAVDTNLGRAAVQLQEKLKRIWEQQLEETLTIKMFLEPMLPNGQTIPQNIRDLAHVMAQREVSAVIPQSI
jgi:hypothetical protein